jgi:hypothetical protein
MAAQASASTCGVRFAWQHVSDHIQRAAARHLLSEPPTDLSRGSAAAATADAPVTAAAAAVGGLARGYSRAPYVVLGAHLPHDAASCCHRCS